jgi:hypothetical protein
MGVPMAVAVAVGMLVPLSVVVPMPRMAGKS